MLDQMVVSDPEGDYYFKVEAKISAGQMIFTIQKYLAETGEIVSSESHFENRFMHRYASEYEDGVKLTEDEGAVSTVTPKEK